MFNTTIMMFIEIVKKSTHLNLYSDVEVCLFEISAGLPVILQTDLLITISPKTGYLL